MSVYYNEIDEFNVEWLKCLIKRGAIAPGEVDGRSIKNVKCEDLRGFTQCHFFAGIGVWPYSLRSSGWPDEKRAWTGSCPCQPFSISGDGGGSSDERHLWPIWNPLIEESRPIVIFGEQVASDDGLAWLDLVSSDLERSGYTVGSVDTSACGFGAPHIRQRLYFVAHIDGDRMSGCIAPESLGQIGPWGTFGQMDLQQIIDGPFVRGRSWPEPLIRKVGNGTPNYMGRIRGYGNALVSAQAEAFIRAYILDNREYSFASSIATGEIEF